LVKLGEQVIIGSNPRGGVGGKEKKPNITFGVDKRDYGIKI